jgi:hypothetical protein
MISAGCRIAGINLISDEVLINTYDDNTWISELQRNGKFKSDDIFEWKHLTYDKKTAERKTLRKRNKWSAWATQMKRLTGAMEEVTEAIER